MANQLDLTSKLTPEQLEAMKQLVAKAQGEGKAYRTTKQVEAQKRQEEERKLSEARRQAVELNEGKVVLGKADHLFLDDVRNPGDVTWVNLPVGVNWRKVATYQEFVDYIKKEGLPKFISFDHDLGAKAEQTGIDAAKWLVDYCLKEKLSLPVWAAHSSTVTGRQQIEEALFSYNKTRVREPKKKRELTPEELKRAKALVKQIQQAS